MAGHRPLRRGQQQLPRHPEMDDQGVGPVVEGQEEELPDPPRGAERRTPETLHEGLGLLPAHRPGAGDGHRRHRPARHLPLQTPADDLDLRKLRH